MVPDFRRGNIWTSAFARVTLQRLFTRPLKLFLPFGPPGKSFSWLFHRLGEEKIMEMLLKWIDALSLWSGKAASWIIFSLMFVITYEVIMR